VDAGLKPACVTKCVTHCLDFGIIMDSASQKKRDFFARTVAFQVME
jgi:Fe-S-cluster-containing dehydrogenase component